MALSNDLIAEFVKLTNGEKQPPSETTMYGTAVEYNGQIYVRLDGSDRMTPVTSTVSIKPGERVMVLMKKHTATVTGNISSPSASDSDVKEVDKKVQNVSDQISEFEIIIADKVSTDQLEAAVGRITKLETDNVTVNKKLTVNEADISDLKAKNAEITERLTVNEADIDDLNAKKLDVEVADIKYATIENLEATDATIRNLKSDYADFKDTTTEKLTAHDATINKLDVDKLNVTDADVKYATIKNLEATDADLKNLMSDHADFKEATAGKFTAQDASIKKLDTEKLSVDAANIKYANIDFTNIGKAAMEYFYAQSGLIKDVTVGDQTITGELVGVTIKGDLIEGNTIVADKLVIKGEDGLYYKLNTDGATVEKEQTDYNSLNGQVIQAKSVTAEKISVNDLVAFDATIAGFSITDSALYSGAKASATNGTRGIYLGKDGQVSFGDGQNYIMYFKDTDGSWKLAISANSITFSSGRNIEDVISSMQDRMDEIADEVTTSLYVTSSKGNVFKNTNVSTILSVTIIRGTQRITDSETLALVFGEGAFLQWRYQLNDSDDYLTLAPEDQRITEGGFKFKISPDDIDTKGVYACDLIVEEKEKNQNGN